MSHDGALEAARQQAAAATAAAQQAQQQADAALAQLARVSFFL